MMRAASSPIAAHGERKFAVVMFADLTGYTELCRRLDPEDVAAVVRPVMFAMKAAVEEAGGVVPSVAGDGFMAVFGIPNADELAANKALNVTDRLRRLVRSSNQSSRTIRIPDVHVGVAAGEVLVVPSDESTGWSLVGNPVNLAARLCDAAGPDEVLMDSATQDLLLPGRVDVRPRDIPIGGVADALAVWSVEHSEDPVETPSIAAPFVDRTAILQRLDGLARDIVVSGKSRVMLVAGEAGIGKSRTVQHWLSTSALRHAWIWCGAPGETSALTHLVNGLAAATGGSALPVVLPQQSPSDATPMRPDPFPGAVAVARDQVTRFAALGASVIVIDDAHSADPSLVAFLRNIRNEPLPVAALVLATWRTDEVEPPWQPDIVLDPLPPEDSSALFAAVLGADPPEPLKEAVVRRIGGHPLMAIQSAAYLVESGVVTVASGACELRRPDAIDVLPTSLKLFVAARLDRLPATAKASLQELSTFGEQMGRQAVEQLCRRHVHATIPNLIDRGFLRESETGWRFTHGLVQHVSYGSLPRSVRAEMHRRQAQFYRDRDTGEYLAHAMGWAQCTPASDPEQARGAVQEALRAAGMRARILFATQAEAAHAVVKQVGPLLADHEHHFPTFAAQLYVVDAQSLIEMGRFEDAELAADKALRLSPATHAERLPAMLAKGHALSRLRRFQAARQTLEDALALADSNADNVSRGQTLRLLGDTYRHTSYPEFVRLTEEAFETLAAAGAHEAATECACILAYLRSVSTQYEHWRDIASSRVYEDDVRGRLWLARADLEALNVRRNDSAALLAAETAVQVGRTIGALDGLADGLAGVARSAAALGQLSTAISAGEELRSLAITHANPRMRLVAAQELMIPLLRIGRLDEALADLDYARNAMDGFGASEAAAFSRCAAVVARDRGMWQQAAGYFTRAGDESDAVGNLERLLTLVAETMVHSEQPPPAEYVRGLASRCRDMGVPIVASLAEAIAEQRQVAEGDGTELSDAPSGACLEERAIRRDTVALVAARGGRDASAAWCDAAIAWQRLGYTIFLARAQARAGDALAASETLDAIGADDAAREWARQG